MYLHTNKINVEFLLQTLNNLVLGTNEICGIRVQCYMPSEEMELKNQQKK